MIGGALGAYLAARRTRTRFLGFADAVAPGLSIGQALGRFGKTVLSSDKIVGTYNWQTQQARWTGDIRPDRSGPVALQAGSMIW